MGASRTQRGEDDGPENKVFSYNERLRKADTVLRTFGIDLRAQPGTTNEHQRRCYYLALSLTAKRVPFPGADCTDNVAPSASAVC